MSNNLKQHGNNRSNIVYTHQLPYGIRRDICNLLDADQSWRTLGGQFLNLDNTQLTLIGQAYLRNSTPSEELLLKLDSANMQIAQLCYFLKRMNNHRAVQLLEEQIGSQNCLDTTTNNTQMTSQKTLYTPTPSFADFNNQQAPALMQFGEQFDIANDVNQCVDHMDQNLSNCQAMEQTKMLPMPPSQCHNDKNNAASPAPLVDRGLAGVRSDIIELVQKENQHNQIEPKQNKSSPKVDPGEEIVKLACANNRRRTSISDQEVVNQLRLIMQITYDELKQASNDFSDSNILGNGGFASVYRGHWKGTDVAIKRLRCNLIDQALNELTILNSYRIDNILPIYGISIDGTAACLVYQFMANGSLEDRLSCKKGTPPLNWLQRALISEGVAKGLYYLHTLRDKPLVHGDVKSANVLLDAQFVPKLGDFGLARQVFKGKNPQTELATHCTVSSIHGTSVYLPAEYLRHKILSSAVDVYSYGIVLLEMATGKRAYDGKRLLIDFIEDELKSQSMERISQTLKDHRLANDRSKMGFKIWYELLFALGLSCAHKIKKKRPDMGQVLNRFASFHANPDASNLNEAPDQAPSSNIMLNDLLISNACQSSTRQAATPELATLENKQYLFQGTESSRATNGTGQRNNNNNNHNASLRSPAGGSPMAVNSALMSVDEEVVGPGGELRFVDNANQHQQAPVAAKETQDNQAAEQQQQPGQFEAMIPLLTELGIGPDN